MALGDHKIDEVLHRLAVGDADLVEIVISHAVQQHTCQMMAGDVCQCALRIG